MRKLFMVAAFLALGVFFFAPLASANPPTTPTLDWQTPTSVEACPPGIMVINVHHDVLNDVDSRVGGGVWALDRYSRSIKVVDVGGGKFCAVLRYNGNFTTFAGASPQGTGTVAAGIEGKMKGGYRTTVFTGTLNPNPAYPVKGQIGTFNYGCLPTDTGGHDTCTGLFSWVGTYFTSTSGFDLAWWGWIYSTKDNGTWVNAISGNLGDITGVLHP